MKDTTAALRSTSAIDSGAGAGGIGGEFMHLITSWRLAWGYVIPFLWVQLHPWGPGGETRKTASLCMLQS